MAVLTKKSRRCTAIILLPALLCAVAVAYGQEEEIEIDNLGAYTRDQRPAVRFSHELHMDIYECLDCHHDYDHGANVLDEGDLEEGNPAIRCVSCHDFGSTIDLRRAYHVQCLGCHKRARISGQATGPELCGACHIK